MSAPKFKALVADGRSPNVEELVSHLLFPSRRRKRLRSTNLLERTFVEVRRRTKVIGRFPAGPCPSH